MDELIKKCNSIMWSQFTFYKYFNRNHKAKHQLQIDNRERDGMLLMASQNDSDNHLFEHPDSHPAQGFLPAILIR